jgi:hypothetical protein
MAFGITYTYRGFNVGKSLFFSHFLIISHYFIKKRVLPRVRNQGAKFQQIKLNHRANHIDLLHLQI